VTQPAQRNFILRFGAFEADLPAAEVRKNRRRLHLRPLYCKLRTILLKRPREVVSRGDLEQRLSAAAFEKDE